MGLKRLQGKKLERGELRGRVRGMERVDWIGYPEDYGAEEKELRKKEVKMSAQS